MSLGDRNGKARQKQLEKQRGVIPVLERVDLSGSRYQRLFELNFNPIVLLSIDGVFLDLNPAARQMLGFSPEAPATLTLDRLGIPAEDFPKLKDLVMESGSTAWTFEPAAANGRILEAQLSHLPGYLGDEDALQVIVRDAADQVRAERTREQLVNMVVHDLRVPLSNVINSLDLVLVAWRERDVTIPVEQVLGIGLRSAHRMEHLITDILSSARLQAQEYDLNISEVAVADMVADVVDSFSASANRRHQTLHVHVDSDLAPMQGDPDVLRRVLTNLVGNAVKYTHEGGEITVAVTVNEAAFQFAVIDNGPGVLPEDQERIFELFFRGRLRLTQGAGIGLAFCRLAVEAHGGRIWLESIPGEGASFYFTIPRVLSSSAGPQEDPEL